MISSWLLMLQNPATLATYVIFPILIVLGGVYWLMRGRRKNAAKTEQTAPAASGNFPVSSTAPVTVRLWNSQYGKMFTKENISGEIVDQIIADWGSLGRLWDESGEKLFEINRYQKENKTWSYRPIEARITDTRENSPQRVEGAFHHDAAPIVYNVKWEGNAFGKIAPILWFCGFAIFVMMVILLKE